MASCSWSPTETLKLSAPATAWAADITRFGPMTTPLPSRIFWQACATLRTLTTLRAASATTASLACEASGGSTVTIGAGPDGWVNSVIRESDSTTLPQPVATPIDRAMAAISEAVDRIRLIAETIEPSFVALSVGQA